MSLSSPQRSPESSREWDGRVAAEARHQARIEAAFDRAEAFERSGDLEHALEALSEAGELGGDLPPEYRGQAFRWRQELLGRQGGANVVVLRGGPEACRAARQALLAREAAVDDSVRDDVLLLVTELVSNAVRHAGVGPDGSVHIELSRKGRGLRVEVTDPGTASEQVVPSSGPGAAGGWGLHLVDRIADRWGVTPTWSGTCVWFEIGHEGSHRKEQR